MKPQDYVSLDFQNLTSAPEPSPTDATLPNPAAEALGGEPEGAAGVRRREFLARLGGGIVIFVSLGDLVEAAEGARGQRGGRPGGGLPTDFNAFLRIDEDGKVTCFTGKIEMGQGPITSLPQMLADELEAPLE